MNKKGYLLINLGTPEAPTRRSVKKYLQTFLMDERVIALPSFIRWILVYGIIAPFRSGRSAHAYQQVWTSSGSPLAVHGQHLIEKLRDKLPRDVNLALAMRYGEPSIEKALKQLAECDEIIILPLYPQYASATNGSSTVAVFDYFKQQQIIPNIRVIRDFYQHPAYIHALCESIKPYLKQDYHLLLSYHGLPENQLEKIGCKPVCKTPCPQSITSGKACYRQQCFMTSNSIASTLNLDEKNYTISFQSRLGKTPWIQPYTDEVIENLAKQGVKNLLVACPAFVADCLETLEEIGIQAKEKWEELGGHQLTLIPCLNDQEIWVEALIEILKN
jgi:ferrochelatase